MIDSPAQPQRTRNPSRSTWIHAGFVAIILLVMILWGIAFRDYGYDDPYITYRYARNLLEGKGLVYNPGERVLSTTAPGYALALAGLGLLGDNMPLQSNLLGVAGLGASTFVLYLWGRKVGTLFAGAAAGLLLLTFPLLATTLGSEMCLFIGCVLGALYMGAATRPVPAMALAAAATMIRPDGALAAVLLVFHFVISLRRVPWNAIALYLLILTPWLVLGTLYFGSPIPVTLAVKRAQGELAFSERFVRRLIKLVAAYGANPLYWLFVPLGVLGIWQILTRRPKWGLLLLWTGAYGISYAVLGVSGYFWYYAPLVPGVVLCVAVGLNWLIEQIQHWRPHALWPKVVAPLVLVVLLWPNIQGILALAARRTDERLPNYRQVGEWIDAHLPADASVGMVEVGIIGYYARRHVIDFYGLIQPPVAEQMNYETTFLDTTHWAIETYHPGYLVLEPPWFEGLGDLVAESCYPLQTFTHASYRGELLVYGCDWNQ